jgi:hypothetical protein
MPEFVFEPDRVAAILAYLKSIQQRRASRPPALQTQSAQKRIRTG